MIDFNLSLSDLQKAVDLMTGVRKSKKSDTLDITCAGSTVRFVTLGRDFTVDATIAHKGQARLPLALFARFAELAQSYGKSQIRLRIEPGKVYVETMSLKDEAVTLGHITDRPIDAPDECSPLDLLAFKVLFSVGELRASDLADRVDAAEKHRKQDLIRAAEALAKYGITAATLEAAVANSISGQADRLQPMLKPSVISKQIN